MEISSYFQNEYHKANGIYNNADGDGVWADQYDSFDGGQAQFPAYSYAQGGATMAATSLPYIIQIQNTTSAAIPNVTILNAANAVYSSDTTGFGNTTGIVLTSLTNDTTYRALLNQSMTKPFLVGQTYLFSSTANQVNETFTVVQRDATGVSQRIPVVPVIDPYQFQSGAVTVDVPYVCDANCAIIFSQIYANTTLQVRLYTAQTNSVTRPLVGQAPVSTFKNPNVIRPQKIALQGNSLAALGQ